MTLLSGASLTPDKFFRIGKPTAQGSSFDLTIGKIFDHDGKEVDGPFTLKPGHMVQVVSAEVFNLGNDVTGHVTYKTTLTRVGIWALTVGIVDPGWDGPIGTSLMNFSRNDHTIHAGDGFLRVSMFQHEPVSDDMLRGARSLKDYHKDLQKLAASAFPMTFLNSDDIAKTAGNAVLDRIRKEAVIWIGGIALIFGLASRFFSPVPADLGLDTAVLKAQVVQLQSHVDDLTVRLSEGAAEAENPTR